MDEKEIIKWGLIALGAYLIYEYIQQQGGLTNVLAGSTTGTGSGTSSALTANGSAVLNALMIQAAVPPLPASVVTSLALNATQAGILNAAQIPANPETAAALFAQLNLTETQMSLILRYTASLQPTGPEMQSHTAPTNTQTTTGPTACPMGQVLQGGVCVTAPPASQPALLMSQQVLNAATAAGEPNNLNIDQWNFYYQQISGQQVSLPDIPTSVYTSAGVQPNADGSGPDNTSPMPVSTWLAIMQLEMPQLGLSGFRGGMGTFAKYRPHWLN